MQLLESNPGRIEVIRNGNESGILWESLWKFEEGKFKKKSVCSGNFSGWLTFENRKRALTALKHTVEIARNGTLQVERILEK